MPVSISNIPACSNSNNIPVTKEYDSLWGFYTFSQTISYEYDEIGMSGLSSAIITINGYFTANAEGLPNSNSSDTSNCDSLLEKYSLLRQKLLSTINKSIPDNLSDIGTSTDRRCIELPCKLKDNSGNAVYAIPVSFSTTEISPQILRYTVQLKEPQKVPCKIKIEGKIINNAIISIVCRRPRIKYRTLAFASGSEAYVTGIDNRMYYISGSIPLSPSDTNNTDGDFLILGSNSSSESYSCSCEINNNIVSIINSIITKDGGRVGIGIERNGGSNSNSFHVMVTEHNVNVDFTNRVVDIDISGEETNSNSSSSSN